MNLVDLQNELQCHVAGVSRYSGNSKMCADALRIVRAFAALERMAGSRDSSLSVVIGHFTDDGSPWAITCGDQPDETYGDSLLEAIEARMKEEK